VETEFFIHRSAIVDTQGEWRAKGQGNPKIGKGTNIWHFSHVCLGSSIGDQCIIGQNVYIGPNVVIGNNCRIQNNVSVYDGVTIGNDVFVGPSVVFTNVKLPRPKVKAKRFDKIIIEDSVMIGANSTIVAPCTIRSGASIGAGSVVTMREVPPNSIIYGNPARVQSWKRQENSQDKG
jgi:UDP-2-acetamido-3-amino-2,3-dideoxy-glucuronate N-acetyltransferase